MTKTAGKHRGRALLSSLAALALTACAGDSAVHRAASAPVPEGAGDHHFAVYLQYRLAADGLHSTGGDDGSSAREALPFCSFRPDVL